jgi:catechol 2,3-dioxygenase-like lactoylglutathione lyase family enzyme
VPTSDLAESRRFYGEALGLELIDEWDEMGTGALFAVTDNVHIELIATAHVPPRLEPTTGIGLEVADADAVYERVLAHGFVAKGPPRDRAWGKRGFGTHDPNGVPVNVYHPLT